MNVNDNDNEDLSRFTDQFNDTVKQLHAVWRETGLPEMEQKKSIDVMKKEVFQVLHNKLAYELEMKTSLELDIKNTKTKIVAICVALDKDVKRVFAPDNRLSEVDCSINRTTGHTLMQQITTLQSLHESLQEERQQCLESLTTRLDTLHGLYNLIGLKIEMHFKDVGTKLTPTRASEIDEKIHELELAKKNRSHSVRTVTKEIQDLWKQLGISEFTSDLEIAIHADDAASHSSSSSIGLSDDIIEKLSSIVKSLVDLKESREDQLRVLGKEISALWFQLHVPQDYQTEFFADKDGVTQVVVTACEKELERMKLMKSEKLGDIIMECRAKIMVLWDECFVPTHERQKIKIMDTSDDMFTDEILLDHEKLLQNLKEKHAEIMPILKLIRRRSQIIIKREEFESIISDPNRLLDRKGGKNLLHERNLEKEVKFLPSVESKLRVRITEWEAKYGTFYALVGGEMGFIVNMDNENATYRADKKAKKDAKQSSKSSENSNTSNKFRSSTSSRTSKGPGSLKKSSSLRGSIRTPLSARQLGNPSTITPARASSTTKKLFNGSK